MRRGAQGLMLTAIMTCLVAANAQAQPPAKELFGGIERPSSDAPQALGSYARGCLVGGVPLAEAGAGFQTMRPSRNRHWGHPSLVAYVERLAAELRTRGHPGLLVGDMAQPRGGPMRTGHRSHQIGLDADIWFKPAPAAPFDYAARENVSAVSLLQTGTRELDWAAFDSFGALEVVKTAARDPEVARIFVHPAIKRGFCARAGDERDWLRKVRPWWGHHYHFHVRLACPAGSVGCRDQDPPPPGDGCGAELAWWFTDEPWQPSTTPPKPPLRMADLPPRCATLVTPR